MWSRYVRRMGRAAQVGREYWFELLMAVLAVAGMLELVVGRDAPGAPGTPLWLSVPAVAVLVAPLLLRRSFPFAAPTLYWLMAATLTYFDGALVPFIGSLGVVGMAAAFLLGNLRDNRQAGVGLAIVQKGIERMGGRVGVESEKGVGSRFWIELQRPE